MKYLLTCDVHDTILCFYNCHYFLNKLILTKSANVIIILDYLKKCVPSCHTYPMGEYILMD